VLAETSLVLLGLLWLCLLVAGTHRIFGVSAAGIVARMFSYLLFIVVCITGASVLRWALDPVFPGRLYEGAGWHFSLTELQLFYSGSILCPLFLVVIVAVVVVFPVAMVYVSSLVSLLGRAGSRLQDGFRGWLDSLRLSSIEFRLPFDARVGLLAAVVVSLVVVYYPYAVAINPKGSFVGVDFIRYASWLDLMSSRSFWDALSYVFTERPADRPFSALFHYFFKGATGISSSDAVKLAPLLFSPFLVFSVFLFVRELAADDNLAVLAALISSTSFSATVGMYAGFLANWFALPMVYLGLAALLRSLKGESRGMLVLAVLAFASSLYTHPYTWGLVMASLLLYLLWMMLRRYRRGVQLHRWSMLAIAVVLAANLFADLVKSQVLLSVSGVAVESGIAAGNLSLDNFLGFWENLLFAFRYYVGGYFTQPLALFLALMGTYVLVRREDPGSRILIAWLSVVALPLFFGSFMVQSRILYDLPLDVLSAIGLYSILGVLHGKGGRENRVLTYLFLAWVLLVYFNYGFRCMRNLLPSPW